MGLLSKFNLKNIKSDFEISHLVETGSWYGDGIQYGVSQGYSVESCEINSKLHFIVSDRFKTNDRVKIYQLPSYKFIPIADEQKPTVFWLDAHLPELYVHHDEGISFSKDLSTPLETELTLISQKQNFNKSVIIIDDLRMYDTGLKFSGGNIDLLSPLKIIDFLMDTFSQTHKAFFSPVDEGYAILIPRIAVNINRYATQPIF